MAKERKRLSRFKTLLLVLMSLALISGLFINYNVFNVQDVYADHLIEKEKRQTFDFLHDHSNLNPKSPGYGLVVDRKSQKTVASIAAVGMALAVYPIAVENDYLSFDQAKEITNGTLDTLLNTLEEVEGFFYHFIYMDSGKRYAKSEVSIIDTGIAIMGALIAGAFFGEEIAIKAEKLYERVNWQWYFNSNNQKFFMEYLPENGVHSGEWGVYAEQMLLYILSSESANFAVPTSAYYKFDRQKEEHFDFVNFVRSPINAHFAYQYSNAFVDYRNLFDLYGDNWHQNSIEATVYAKQFAIETSAYFKTFNENQWGLTAGDGLNGYNGLYGSDIRQPNDGSLSLTGLLASIAFVPQDVKEAVLNLKKDRRLWHKDYGLIEGFNDEKEERIYFDDLISINKLMNLIMIENAQTSLIWDLSKKVSVINNGLQSLGYSDKKPLSFWSSYQKKDIELVDKQSITKETDHIVFEENGKALFKLNQEIKEGSYFSLLGTGNFNLKFLDKNKELLGEQSLTAGDQSLNLDQIDCTGLKYLELSSDSIAQLKYLGFQTDVLEDKVLIQANQRPYLAADINVYVDGIESLDQARYGMEVEGEKIKWKKKAKFKIPRTAKAKKVRFLVNVNDVIYKGPYYKVLIEKPTLSASKEKILLQHALLPSGEIDGKWKDGGDHVYKIEHSSDKEDKIIANKKDLAWSYVKRDYLLKKEQKNVSICYQSKGKWLLKLEDNQGQTVEWNLNQAQTNVCKEFKIPKEMLTKHDQEIAVFLFALPGEEQGKASIEIKIQEGDHD